MITAIVFSKDRPLQLDAYLQSLQHYSGMDPECIHVLYKETLDIPYDSVKAAFPSVHWVKEGEGTFFIDLMRILELTPARFILWGCDDVVFKESFDLAQIEACFQDQELLTFSLRHGKNLVGWDLVLSNSALYRKDGIIVFDRGKGGVYPWDVSAAVYRKSDIMAALSIQVTLDEHAYQIPGVQLPALPIGTVVPASSLITGPNKLEWVVVNWVAFYGLTHMACYETSRSLSFSVNRVQEVSPNVYDQGPGMGPKELYLAYKTGRRLDWKSLYEWQNSYTHEGSERFRLV